MIKKMMLLAMAVGALAAFWAPAAQAETANTLTDPVGTSLPVGTEVTGTSSNLVTTLESGAVLACEKVTLHMEITHNHALALRQLGEATTENCNTFAPEPHPTTITDGTVGEIAFNGSGEASATASFGADIPEFAAECELEGSVSVLATTGTSTIDIGPSALEGGGNSPLCTGGTIEGSFQLETANGTAIVID